MAEDSTPHDWALGVGDPALLLSEQYPSTLRHLAQRAQLVNLLLDHPHIVAAAERVNRRSLEEAWRLLVAAGAALGDSDEAADKLLASPEWRDYHVALDRWQRRLLRALGRVLAALDTKHEGRFRWVFLLHDLGTAYMRWNLYGATTTEFEIGDRRPARIVAEPRDGESKREFLARLRQMMDASPTPSKKNRAPVRKLDQQLQYAVWFYRHYALGEGVEALAREYHKANHAGTRREYGRTTDPKGKQKNRCDDRNMVRYGLRQAERYLSGFPSHSLPRG